MAAITTTLYPATIHLALTDEEGRRNAVGASRRGLRLTDLQVGETVRVLRVAMKDLGCKKRLAEMGVAEGMRIKLVSKAGGQVMIQVGGAKMGLGEGCASEISVMRV